MAESGIAGVSDTRSYLSRAALSGAAEVRLIETVLWRDARNASRGLTTCWLIAQQTRCELRLPWSANANLQVARWDHRSMAVKVGADENLIIRVEGLAPGSVHRLQLEWGSPDSCNRRRCRRALATALEPFGSGRNRRSASPSGILHSAGPASGSTKRCIATSHCGTAWPVRGRHC